MFGICIGIGWYGFGVRRDFFTAWLDVGILTFGFTAARARADFARVQVALRRLSGMQ